MPGSPVWSAHAAPGLKLSFPVEEGCSAVLWCVKLVATVPAVTTILPPTGSSFSRDRFLDPAVWQGFHHRLLPLQSLRSPDPPRTRSRNTTAEPLRDQKYQISEEKMRKVLEERMGRRELSPGWHSKSHCLKSNQCIFQIRLPKYELMKDSEVTSR